MSRVLFTADWQLCNSLPHSRVTEDGETDRLRDQLSVVSKIGEIAKAENVDEIFLLGDVFERRLLDAITLRAGMSAVIQLSQIAPVRMLPGNHDVNSSTGERDLLEAFVELQDERVTHLSKYEYVMKTSDQVAFFPAPWLPVSLARKKIERLRAGRIKSCLNVLLLHQGINGCKDGGWVCENELEDREVCEGWDLVLAGHFHDRQVFGPCGEYVGAPMQHDFRDAGAGDRGVLVVDFKGREAPTKKFVVIDSPKFFVHKWDFGHDNKQLISRKLGVRTGDYLRIDVEATSQQWSALQPEVDSLVSFYRQGVNVMPPKHLPIAQIETRLQTSSDAPSVEEAIARYVEFANTEGLDKQRLLEVARGVLKEVGNG
jgi:DNA repair exonuclease SbcCD nuclease subunit